MNTSGNHIVSALFLEFNAPWLLSERKSQKYNCVLYKDYVLHRQLSGEADPLVHFQSL